MSDLLKQDLKTIRQLVVNIKDGLIAGRVQRKDRDEYINKLKEIIKLIEDVAWRNIHSEASLRYQKEKGKIKDPYDTLKMVIDIFEEAGSTKDELYNAQRYIFDQHPELELIDGEKEE